jgi:CheY-like chemotaxis protein
MKALHKILVVDDDPVVGKSFDRVLTDKGYAVITARDGEEALRKLNDGHYDLVFTDIKMPGMSGLDMTERIKTTRPWLPVVIVTGYGSQDNEARAEAAGVAGFLRKPLSPEMIETSARMALLDKAPAEAAPLDEPAAVPAEQGEEARPGVARYLKNVALFFAAPFVGLAYILALPLVGIGALAWMGGKALMKYPPAARVMRVLRTAALAVMAPFVGLAYVIALPFVGLGMLVWMGIRAAIGNPDARW